MRVIDECLALALVLGKRHGWPGDQSRPHNLPAVMLGAGILWFGWFGFNAGSALAANGVAATAFLNTMLADGTGMLGRQALAVLVTIAYSGILTFVIALLVQKTIGLRVDAEDELAGIDEAEHAETGYDHGHGRFGAHVTGAYAALLSRRT